MGIYIDQVGYRTEDKKVAVSNKGGVYEVIDLADDSVVYSDEAMADGYDTSAGEDTWSFDFSIITKPGKYYIKEQGADIRSYSFEIGDNVYCNLKNALIKALYFQRCGCGLTEKHAGVYMHAPCHTDTVILLKDYLNKNANPQRFECLGGWHDAGDFGRYSTPASVAVGHLLYAYELFPDSFKDEINIPESGNGIPDVLNECKYELAWLLKMQADDGGVYHKLTAFNHADFIMPEDDHDQFILYDVSSMAVADYVAVMALASRVYREFDEDFANRALESARISFRWLETHDYVGFHNPDGSNTGEYGDSSDVDERMWAAAEMLRTDVKGDVESYRTMLRECIDEGNESITDFGWTDVSGFTLLALLTDDTMRAGENVVKQLKTILFDEADRLCAVADASGYDLCMENDDYVWGSNMVVCNRGILLSLASMLTDSEGRSKTYEMRAIDCLHYLLGRNALNRSYVTGFGEGAYRNPHNRTSACDGIDDPMPGWVSGGPFKTPCDDDAKVIIPFGTAPMKCHADFVGSYSTNEITIYWNSPATFITAFVCSGIDKFNY